MKTRKILLVNKMNTYTVEIREILSKKVVVEALSKNHAENIVRSKYFDRDIKLGPDNCIDSSVTCISSDEKDDQPSLFD